MTDAKGPELLEKVEESVLEYGNAILKMLGNVLPVFDKIVDATTTSLEKLVHLRLASDNIRRAGRMKYLTGLIEAGATPEDAAKIIYREMELVHESNSEVAAMLQEVSPMLQSGVGALAMQAAQLDEEPPPEASKEE